MMISGIQYYWLVAIGPVTGLICALLINFADEIILGSTALSAAFFALFLLTKNITQRFVWPADPP